MLHCAGYWSSWPAEDVRASPQFKESVGWGPDEPTICMVRTSDSLHAMCMMCCFRVTAVPACFK